MLRIRFIVPLFLLVVSTSVFAQATRTWVSGLGADSNPCSRSAPCKTFAGAFANTAVNGEIDVVDAGGYGGLTITHGIRIDGRGFVSSVLSSGFTINTTDHVELANLQLNGINSWGEGVHVNAVGSLLIDNCDIMGYYNDGVYIATAVSTPVQILNSRIHNLTAGANGVYATTSSGLIRLRITNSTISDNFGSYAVWAATNSLVTVDHTQLSGVYAGVRADALSTVNITNSTINHNTGYGVYSLATGGLIRVYSSFIQDNVSGGYLVTSPSVIQSTGNNSIQPGAGVALSGIGLQ